MNESLPMTVADYWNLVVRRKWLIAGIILLSVGIAGVMSLVLPKSYRSNTLILVEDQKIPEDYVKAIVGGNIESRLIMIKQQVMSRTLLSRVMEEFKLYEGARGEALEEAIMDMQTSIVVETVGTPAGRGKTVEAFSISYAHRDPVIAMKVTAKLASQFIEENLRVREQFVEGASEFLEQELGKAKEGLEAQEQTISDFRQKYMGELPQQMEANLRALDRLQAEMTMTTESINTIAERLGLMDKAIQDYETSGTTTPGLGGTPGSDPLVQRLRELEQQLTTLSALYKDTYPDVINTRQELQAVKAQLMEKHSLSAQDVNLETLKHFDPYLIGLLRQRDETRLELSALKQRQLRLATQVEEYEGRVERTPAREQDLMILVRDYDNMQRNYQSLLDKKLNAQVAENLEKRQKGEQFRIIDPANLPEKPEQPNQAQIMLIGLLAGCGLGFGGAYAADQLRATFRRPEEAELLLGIPLLAAIPDFKSAYGVNGKALPAPSKTDTAAAGAASLQSRGLLAPWKKFINGNGKANGNGTGAWPVEYNLVSKWRPISLVAEQFRVAATRLTLMSGDRVNTVVVVSSALKGEGKTAAAVNLGYTLARDLGKTTLLIDCDLKSPAVHTYLRTGLEPGLAEVLQGTHTLEDSIHPLEKWPLWVLPAGNQNQEPIELSKVGQLTKLLTTLRGRFDYIILDAPPILPLADMNVLAGMADLLALVIRADTTSRDVVKKALNSLKPRIQSGIILTGVWADGIPSYMQETHVGQARKVRA